MTAVRDIASTRTLAGIAMRDGGNVLRNVTLVKVRSLEGLGEVLAAMEASASPGLVTGRVNSGLAAVVQTKATGVTVTGGTAPYAYSWNRTDANSGTWTISSPSSASTSFVAHDVEGGVSFEATFACTVTDSVGGSVVSSSVTAQASNIGYYGGGGGPLP